MGFTARALAFVLALASAAIVHAEDWELSRDRGSPDATRKGSGRARAPAPTKVDRAQSAARDRNDVQRARYLDLLVRDPMDTSALDRVLALYRERDGNLGGLLSELAARADRDATVVSLRLLRARVLAADGDAPSAREELARLRAEGVALEAAWLLSAQLERAAGDLNAAASLLRQALERTSDRAFERALLTELATLDLDRGDFDAAERSFDALAAERSAGSFRITAFARALAARQEHARAAQAYGKALTRLGGDPRAQAPVLLELAKSELEAGQADTALKTLQRARTAARGAPGLLHGLNELRVEAHRRTGRLQELAEQLSRAGSSRFEDAEQLGNILDELGDTSGALSAFRRALARKPRAAAIGARVVALLLREGRLKEAIAEQRALVRAAGGDARQAIRLAEILREAGEQDEAVRLLDAAAIRSARDGSAVQALLTLLSRWGEHERVTRLLARLARAAPNDPSHLLALGEQLLAQGETVAATRAFERALAAWGDAAEGHAALGMVLLDHDQAERAVVELEAAVAARPDNPTWLRSLAEALERVRRPVQAVERWKQVLAQGTDPQLAREARRRIVLLWAQSGELRARIVELERAFGFSPRSGVSKLDAPPDLEAGRLLAEAYRSLAMSSRRARGEASLVLAAERVLQHLLSHAPGDVSAMLALERSQSARGDYVEAEKTLHALLGADPKSAPTYLARLADYAEAAYRDAEALAYVERLVNHSPKDATARARLARLHRDRQELDRARASYEQAIELDPQRYAVHLELAALLLAQGDELAADSLLLRVVRGSSDDEQVRHAALSLSQIRLARGALASLEGELLPLSLGERSRPVHRALLCELYASLARPWLAALADGGPPAASARERLRELGKRAVKPLLEALASTDPSARRVAVDLLAPMENPSAAAALLGTAEREGDVELRRRALLAAGLVADESLTARIVVLAGSEERRLRDAATWALARLQGERATRALGTLVASPMPSVRGLALVGLGRRGGAGSAMHARRALENDPSSFVRASAALALAMTAGPQSVSDLIAALRAEPYDVAAAAAVALGIVQDKRAASVLLETVFVGDPMSRRASLWALQRLAQDPSPYEPPSLPPPSDRTSVEPLLEAHLAHAGPSSVSRAPLERAFETELEAVARSAVSGPLEHARAALRSLTLDGPDRLDPSTRAWLAPRLQQQLLELAERPDSELRDLSLRLVADLDPEAVGPSFARFLSGDDEALRSAALIALSRAPWAESLPAAVQEPLLRLLAKGESWLLRKRCAEVLGRLPSPSVALALGRALAQDRSALVREAAARALAAQPEARRSFEVRALLERTRDRDPEPLVRAQAATALAGYP